MHSFWFWMFILIVMTVINVSLVTGATLTGSSSGSMIENSSLTLTCVGTNSLVRWYRNSLHYDYGYCNKPPDINYRYRRLKGSCSESNSTYTFEITLSKVDRKQHGDVWNCRSSYYSNVIILNVKVPVSYVTIEAEDLIGSTLTIIENKTATLTCRTSHCRPNAGITWSIKDRLNDIQTIDGSNSRFISDEKDTNILYTESIIQVIFDATFNGKTLICMAENIPNYKDVFHHVTLDIVYPPRADENAYIKYVIISDLNKSITMNYAVIAKPLPSFTWFKNGTPIPRDHPRITISSFNLQTNLTIIKVETNDYGNYTLVVTNKHGSIVEVFQLKQAETISQSSESTNIVIGASVGGTVGVVVLVSVLLVVIILRRRNLRQMPEQKQQEVSPSIQTVTDSVVYENMKLGPIQDEEEIVTVNATKITTTEGLQEYEELRWSGGQ